MTITGNTSVTANYSQDAYTLTVVSAHGTVTKSPEQATYRYGDVVTLSATAEPGWTFTGWTPALTDNKVTITGNTSVTANYSQDAYTLTIISAHGTVTKSPEQATYRYGDVVTLSATAEPGWTFTGWTPALTDNKVTITGNTSVTANYSQDAYTLTIVGARRDGDEESGAGDLSLRRCGDAECDGRARLDVHGLDAGADGQQSDDHGQHERDGELHRNTLLLLPAFDLQELEGQPPTKNCPCDPLPFSRMAERGRG